MNELTLEAVSRKTLPKGEFIFSHELSFYRTILGMFVIIALQNIVTYTVNVADNVMLGSYSQTSLSAAASVNQIQYIIQMITTYGFGEGMLIMMTQCWGRNDTERIRRLLFTALSMAIVLGLGVTLAVTIAPGEIMHLFTSDEEIVKEGIRYLSVIRFTYIPFMCTSVLLSALRSIQIVGIAFRLSVLSLFVNAGINWILIFGHLGAPQMGITGAAIGTLTARCIELIIMLLYVFKGKLPMRFMPKNSDELFSARDGELLISFLRVAVPCAFSSLLFAITVAFQTGIMGHISSDAIAANSVSSTIFQYCKMIPSALAAAVSVFIGQSIGRADFKKLRMHVRSIQLISLIIGAFVGLLLFILGNFMLRFYSMTPEAIELARQMIRVLSFTIICTSVQMPALTGIIRGGGDVKYVVKNDVFFTFFVFFPCSLLSAFVFHMPVWFVILMMNLDQIIKVGTNAIYKTHSYSWIKKRG